MTDRPAPPRIDPDRVRAAVAELRAALDAWAAAFAPAVRDAAQQLAAALDHIREAPAAPPAGPARPAWRSPYGPARTRRRK
ncbi:hypothetical protein ACTVZO_22240 [Streptomyces sp. IBSNAI002]|uniref:hypothetical protein n=1 Tax=Streptomyces sp. IBSNAI002 TaxID=3457500 RepID=UPI003FCEF267